jgi:hypothetical protein
VNSHILFYLTYPKKVVSPPPFKNPGYATAPDHNKDRELLNILATVEWFAFSNTSQCKRNVFPGQPIFKVSTMKLATKRPSASVVSSKETQIYFIHGIIVTFTYIIFSY